MKPLKTIFFILIMLLTAACGAGTTGKLKSYVYPIPKKKLADYINDYYSKHPESKKADTVQKYSLSGSGYEKYMFNCYIKSENKEYVFTVRYTGDSTYWKQHVDSEIALSFAGKFGDDIKSNSDLGYFEKKRLIQVFEKGFIDLLPIKPRSTN